MNENKNLTAEEIVLEVMRHFGFRRNYQVAQYFEVTPQTLSGWIKSGEIPPKHLLKFNSEVLVPLFGAFSFLKNTTWCVSCP